MSQPLPFSADSLIEQKEPQASLTSQPDFVKSFYASLHANLAQEGDASNEAKALWFKYLTAAANAVFSNIRKEGSEAGDKESNSTMQ